MLPPLVERELRVALLRRKARKQWMLAAWTAGGLTAFFLLILGLASHRSSGRTLFYWLFALAILMVVTRGFALTADLFSEERRNGTLGLLVLTGLRPWEIFLNKLLGAVLLTAYGLLGGLPFFAIPFLAGGIQAMQFLGAFVFLSNALLFCVAIGLLGSLLHRDGGQAQMTAQAFAALLCLATPALNWLGALISVPLAVPATALALSPAYPAYLVFAGFAGSSLPLFWLGSAITLAYSVTALVLAALILHYTWREKTEVVAPTGWRGRWQTWFRGSAAWQERLRARFLVDQPFCWLAARERPAVVAAYGILALAAVVWLAGWLFVGPRWQSPVNAFISSIILHQALHLAVAYAAARRLAEERLSGGFEILLTVPLDARDLVEGQGRALLVQFRGVGVLALLLNLVFCATSLATLHQDLQGKAIYVLVWLLMLALWFAMDLEAASRAMWISAWTGRPGYAALKAGRGQLWPLVWVWLLSRHSLGDLIQGRGYGLFFLGMLFFIMLSSFSRRHELRKKLIKELRQIACAPIPARGDKRFKSWDSNKIFPPGRWGELVLQPAEPRGRMDSLNG